MLKQVEKGADHLQRIDHRLSVLKPLRAHWLTRYDYSAPLLKSKLFEYHSALVDLQQSSTLTHQCGHFLASFTSNGDIISHRKAKTAICIFKT